MEYTTKPIWAKDEFGEEGILTLTLKLTDYFSITFDFYDRGRIPYESSRSLNGKRRWLGSCGAGVGHWVENYYPQLKSFSDLHLSDADGVPIHFIANGNYHLFKMDEDKFKRIYRLTDKEYSDAKKCCDLYKATSLDTYERFKSEADAAKELLESLINQR